MSNYIKINKYFLDLSLRYLILLIIALNLDIIYNIFTPLTLHLSNTLLSFSYETTIDKTSIFIDTFEINLIPACIAGSAYLLLIILNFSTEMPLDKRVRSLLFILITFLLINVLRITFLTYLFKEDIAYSNLAHEITWYAGSTLILVIIWFINIKLFKIKNLPIFTDVKYIISQIKFETNSKRL